MLKITQAQFDEAIELGMHVCLDDSCSNGGTPCVAAMGHYPNHPDGDDIPARCLRCNQMSMKFVAVAHAQGLIVVGEPPQKAVRKIAAKLENPVQEPQVVMQPRPAWPSSNRGER